MTVKERRKYLREYTNAARQIELGHACTLLLQGMSGAAPARCIKQLQHHSQQALRRLDAAAEKLGAPYGA